MQRRSPFFSSSTMAFISGVSLSLSANRSNVTARKCDVIGRRALLRAAGAGLAVRAAGMLTMRAAEGETVQITDVTVGDGKAVKAGAVVKVHYTLTLNGWQDEPGAKVVDSSRSRGRPFQYKSAAGEVIRGWDQGVGGDNPMKVGGNRKLIIPASLGYGERGAGGVIPAGATLYFDIELLGVN